MESRVAKEQAEIEDLHALPMTVPTGNIRLNYGAYVRNAIIGFADGLTVPFALTAGLSAFGSSKLVISGGLAELLAGALSMGLGAYLATATESAAYDNEVQRERRGFIQDPGLKDVEICKLFEKYAIPQQASRTVAMALHMNPDAGAQFMMEFKLKRERASTIQALLESIVMGISYLLGGLLPMIPYFAIKNVIDALFVSIGITTGTLLVFGYVKAIVTGIGRKGAAWSAVQTFLVGAAAAASSYGIVRAVNSGQVD